MDSSIKARDGHVQTSPEFNANIVFQMNWESLGRIFGTEWFTRGSLEPLDDRSMVLYLYCLVPSDVSPSTTAVENWYLQHILVKYVVLM